ncbi:MFS transporter [Paenibacillus sp. LMG 31459]|uniref:MFS transporter n=1 Tax=Paenibacillus phytohabitans TaxID=2654978 RepID=A0ABX1YD55_9BACL|nr:MFS transporter [Paenibacillus phytohabitans]NOU78932.1 MFS transporter [Paenibacillus phytohabitans]
MLNLLKRNRNFTNYFLADIISGLGTGMSFIGINWYIIDQTSKNSNVGTFMGLNLFAGLIAFIFAGTLADRYNRKNILLFSNLFRGLLILLIAGLLYLDKDNMIMLFMIAIVSGFGWGLYMPASRSLVHELLEQNDIVEGNSALEISLQIGTFLAGGASGFIYKWLGLSGILLIDVSTYLLGAILLLNIKYKALTVTDRASGFFTQFANGFRYLKANKVLFVLGVLSMVPSVIAVSTNVALPGYIKDHLHGTTVALGISDMTYGIGAFLSGLIVGEVLKKVKRQKMVVILFTTASIVLLLLFFNTFILGLYLLYFLLGLSNTFLKITLSSVLMEFTAKEHFGRSMSVWLSLSTIMQIIFSFVIGNIMDSFPAQFGYLTLAIGMVIGFVAYLTTISLISSSKSESKHLVA